MTPVFNDVTGTLTITGTDANEGLTIGQSYPDTFPDQVKVGEVDAAGNVTYFAPPGYGFYHDVQRVIVDLGGGNDWVTRFGLDLEAGLLTIPSTISGGNGNDKFDFTQALSSGAGVANFSLSTGHAGTPQSISTFETIWGSPSDDRLIGNANANLIYGYAGNDSIYGGNGNDTIYGGSGGDKLFGEAAQDMVYGERGNDTITGGSSEDTLVGDAGSDIFYAADGSIDSLFGGNDSDSLGGSDANDILNSIP